MKKTLIIFLLIQAIISNAQIPSDIEIIEIKYMPTWTDSIVQEMDKINQNNIVRLSALDSAAKHHAQYLIIHYLNTDSISHFESSDYPNFIKKISPSDRTGFKYQTLEVAKMKTSSKSVGISELNNNFYKNTPNDGKSLREIFFPSYNWRNIFSSYEDSPSHIGIIKDKRSKFVGSCTVMVVYKTTRGLSREEANRNMVRLKISYFNVTDFIENPDK